MQNLGFNEENYLIANPDVAEAVLLGQFRSGRAHYEAVGKKEGRAFNLACGITREAMVMSTLDITGLGLEIGPSHNPIAPKCKGYRVHILDHLDREGLRNKYAGHAQYGANIDNIEDVDFVWHGEPLSELIRKTSCYDWIIASHVIEHVPDLITFFQQCEALLKKDGRLSLVVPDKRYCFDHFNSVTSTGEFLDAYGEKRSRPSPGKVFDHFSNACKRGGKIAWNSTEAGQFELIHSSEQARSLWQQARTTLDYIDTHCWRFTPESFRLVLSDFVLLGLTSFEMVKNFETIGCEFYVTLGKNGTIAKVSDRLASLQARKSSDI